jgi:hypothetical protein
VNNESHVLQHGYFITRLPANEKEMEQSWNQSREMEKNYFQGHQQWNKVKDKTHLGTPNLVEKLSKRLSSMIEEMYKPNP